MSFERLKQQMDFILEIDKAKEIYRQTYISHSNRTENDAEHSWHLAIMAVVLSEYFPNTDLLRVMKMVLIHDLVEIYAGDTYCYDDVANADKEQREEAAAKRLYSMLPEDQKEEYTGLWHEFELRETPDAVFANILDRIQPVMLNCATSGRAWREHGIYADQVLGRNGFVMRGPEEISAYFKGIIGKAVSAGFLDVR